jgi:mRNA interferase MazF
MTRKHAFTGEVYFTDLPVPKGSEAGFRRPVVVLQAPELADKIKTYICVPLTTTDRLGLIGTCFIQQGDGGLPEDSVAQGYLVMALDPRHLLKKLGRLRPETIEQVALAVIDAMGVRLVQ